MAIITISRGSYSWGKDVAEKVAQRLGYECIAREVLLEASEQFNIPEIKLIRAIQDAPSILDRFTYGKERYISYIQAALLRHVKKDNVVYHGFAGHFFLKDIAHVLKVRIIADMEDRIRLVMERDGIPRDKAIRFLKRIDEQRRKWSKSLYGIDTWDPGLYDMVIHIKKINVEDAVDIICHTVGLKRFQTTPASQREMDDLVLASEVKAALVSLKPDIDVYAHDGFVTVKTRAHESQEAKLNADIRDALKNLPGIKDIEVHVLPMLPFTVEE
jgi:cytidylate kinase